MKQKELFKQELLDLVEFLEKRVSHIQDYVANANSFIRIMKDYLNNPDKVLTFKSEDELLKEINYFVEEYDAYDGFGYDFVWLIQDFARYLETEKSETA